MDPTVAGVIIIAIFAVIIIVGFLRYRQSGGAEIKGPMGIFLKVKGSNEDLAKKKAGITADGITSTDGGMLAEENTGGGIDVKDIQVKNDVLLSSNNSQQNISPKGPPPK